LLRIARVQRILTVCTGNICRSPVAAAMLASGLGEPFRVESAGVGAVVGHGATREAARTAAARGHDVSAHRGRQLDPSLARAFDMLLVMEERHRLWVSRHVPQVRGRTFLFGHWRDLEIPDPIGQPMHVYEHVAALMEQCAADWVARLST
jgi:protein-tyrosine phosphatase